MRMAKISAPRPVKVTAWQSVERDAVSQLCPKCGLCCNGVLFNDVELQPGDNRIRLRSLGLLLERKKGRTLYFSQPCACFDGKLCGIYKDRPVRCRTFECRLLQQVQADEITVASGLQTIERTRRTVERLRRLVRQFGQKDEGLPLNRRYQELLAEPYDLAGDPNLTRLRAQLLRAVSKLVVILERSFLT
ncbi:MAG: YkgJ family cysteine cluster protein [Pedosphaera sp.]|nr:YkgJ family cysteine cluster protein [Pedosphaera sp.]